MSRHVESGENVEAESAAGLSLAAATPLSVRCTSLESDDPLEAGVADRQGRVPGFSQEALSLLTVLVVGAGALGGEIAEGLTRKGVGTLKLLDFDIVGLSNLNRQFFFREDLYEPKAWALARNLVPHGLLGTRIVAWNLSLEDALAGDADLVCDMVISAVDDGRTRVTISQFARDRKIPAIFGGASVEANYAQIFIQEVGSACFGCAFPDEVGEKRNPCPGSPAIKDIFKTLAGIALYAVDSLVMDRPRSWNTYTYCPSDATFTESYTVELRQDCPLCGGGDT